MNRTSFIIQQLIFASFCSAASIEWSAKFSKESSISKVAYVNEIEGFAVANEWLLKTVDGGLTWKKFQLGDTIRLIDISVVSIDTLKAIGYKGYLSNSCNFFNSTNGGQSWSLQPLRIGQYRKVFFVNAKIGWIIGPRIVLYTNDGGNNWVQQTIPDSRINLSSAFFSDSLHGWACGLSSWFMRTTDGGLNWSGQDLSSLIGNITLGSICFINSREGWLGGTSGKIVHTTDGGQTWDVQLNSSASTGISDICFYDSVTGFAVGGPRCIYSTTNGGKVWTSQSCPLPISYLSSIAITGKNNAIAVGDGGGIIRTANGGMDWMYDHFVSSSLIYNISFIGNQGWIVGGTNGIGITFHTGNNGVDWAETNLADSSIMSGIHFLNDSLGWLCGYQGSIQHTIDGGKSWAIQARNTGNNLDNLYDIHFVNASCGWTVGSAGRILSTTDGGSHWISQISGTTAQLRRVHFVNSQKGWIAGDSSFVLETIDGGLHWSRNPLLPHVNDIFFLDSQNGSFLCSQKVYRTLNGGVSFDSIAVGSFSNKVFNCDRISFGNSKIGVISGRGSSFSRSLYALTTDSGNTWTIDSIVALGLSQPMPVRFSDSLTVWVANQSGQLFKGTVSLPTGIQIPKASKNLNQSRNAFLTNTSLCVYDIQGRCLLRTTLRNEDDRLYVLRTIRNCQSRLAKPLIWCEESGGKMMKSSLRLIIENN